MVSGDVQFVFLIEGRTCLTVGWGYSFGGVADQYC